jgi:hypothetical protein
VRVYDLRQGALDPQVVVAKGESEVMSGVRQAAVASKDGQWLFSLYLNHQHGPFIHALNLSNRFALCIDLPADGKADATRQRFWSLALDGSGEQLYAVNGPLGLVAQLDTRGPEIKRVAQLKTVPPAGPLARKPASAATLDKAGKTLFTLDERGLLAIDTSELKLTGRYLTDYTLDSLALDRDGALLYAASSDQKTVLHILPDGSAWRPEQFTEDVRPLAVLRVAD